MSTHLVPFLVAIIVFDLLTVALVLLTGSRWLVDIEEVEVEDEEDAAFDWDAAERQMEDHE